MQELGAHWPFGVPPYGQIGRYCKPLIAQYPFTQVEIHFIHFCQAAQKEVDAEPEKRVYWTLARFAQYFQTWAPPSRSPVFTPYQPVSKAVAVQDGQRVRLEQVSLTDPRPAV